MQQLGQGFVLASFHWIVLASKSLWSFLFESDFSDGVDAVLDRRSFALLFRFLRGLIGALPPAIIVLIKSEQLFCSWWEDSPHCMHSSRSQLWLRQPKKSRRVLAKPYREMFSLHYIVFYQMSCDQISLPPVPSKPAHMQELEFFPLIWASFQARHILAESHECPLNRHLSFAFRPRHHSRPYYLRRL